MLGEAELKRANKQQLDVYSADWCPDCKRLERYFSDIGVSYNKIDIEHVEGAAMKLESETGKKAIPFIYVNNKSWIRGYHKELPQRFDPKILWNELQEVFN